MSKNHIKVRIPHDALIFVGDGRRALFLRNAGTPAEPKFVTENVVTQDDNPSTAAQGADRPGRSFASVGSARSAMEQTDWHDIEEQRFAREAADMIARMVRARDIKHVVIAAPPRTLAELRQSLADDVRAKVIGEVDKDFTKHAVGDIAKHLAEV
jgi:protein required for attachment to host cells